ncbi:phosphatase PAP2 family protein [Corynebacterium pseudopelargi]|uniref:PAP2 superfamily protein n=1 Tax=Corynebacterium pseudopelargi TaxID=2080757 RepID=A0A3G6IUM7_9CORY|nr:phosphatase PAP2 family protein [Corynebacterium pseudopelargi]AZA08318.1 PAP2 superfamily protein [Corynebacterium pseudopelargi]
MREADVLVQIQRNFADRPGVLPAARAMSHFGEHALGWMGLGAAGALVQPAKREQWIRLAGAAFCSHAISVVLKRIVRRKRPNDPRIKVGVATPSKLSFPSSHATSTAAALVSLAYICGKPWPLAGVPVMMFSRMVLGVHYPSDVAAGAGIGVATAVIMKGNK